MVPTELWDVLVTRQLCRIQSRIMTKGSEDTFTLAGSFEASAVHKQLLQTFSC